MNTNRKLTVAWRPPKSNIFHWNKLLFFNIKSEAINGMINTLVPNEIEIYFRHLHIHTVESDNYHTQYVSFVIQLTLRFMPLSFTFYLTVFHPSTREIIIRFALISLTFAYFLLFTYQNKLKKFFFLRCSGVSEWWITAVIENFRRLCHCLRGLEIHFSSSLPAQHWKRKRRERIFII